MTNPPRSRGRMIALSVFWKRGSLGGMKKTSGMIRTAASSTWLFS